MLPSAHRMRRSGDFVTTIRTGRRVGGPMIVVHHLTAPSPAPALVGLVVGKSVGNSVVRHRVSRRLRAQLAPRLISLPPGSSTVVRALPASGAASSHALAGALDRALSRMGTPR